MYGCLTAIAVFPILAVVVIGVSSSGGEGGFSSTSTQEPQGAQVTQNRVSFQAGYDGGYIVGEARHNNKEAGLDSQRLNLMATINAQSHADKDTTRSEADFKTGFIKGYQAGFSGLDRRGVKLPPLPTLPITVEIAQSVVAKDLGIRTSTSDSPYDSLSALIRQQPAKNLFVVTARIVANKNYMIHSKYIYDSRQRIFLKMDRTEVAGDSDYGWSISFDTAPEQVTEDGLWGMDSVLRQVRSKPSDARTTVPIIYKKNRSVTGWP